MSNNEKLELFLKNPTEEKLLKGIENRRIFLKTNYFIFVNQ